jgi:uncharacterized protein (DUF58 family)
MSTPDQNWDFLDMEVVARLSRLELAARQPMLGSITGLHRSATRGTSVEFAEYRKYAPGDDPKFLDWRVFGRTDKFFIREFEADTNLRCTLVLDTSGTMGQENSKQPGKTRLHYGKTIAASLAHLLAGQNDSVGLNLFCDKTLRDLSPKRTPSHLRSLYQTLAEAEPKGEGTIAKVIHELAEKLRSRSLVVIISDLLEDPPQILDALRHLKFYKHDIAIFHLIDRQEVDFDFSRPVRFVDRESGADLITDPAVMAEAYREAVLDYLKIMGEGCSNLGADYHLTYLDMPVEGVLSNFLLNRIRNSKAKGR